MPLPPNTLNYQVGGAIVSIGGLDLGNIVSMEIDPTDLDILQHLTARSGARKVDKQVVTRKRLTFRFGLDEHAAELYRKYFMGGNSGLLVDPLTQPLVELNCTVTYRNEGAVVWSYSHTKVSVRPSGAMDFGEFDEFVGFEVEMEALEDINQPSNPHGRFTFTA